MLVYFVKVKSGNRCQIKLKNQLLFPSKISKLYCATLHPCQGIMEYFTLQVSRYLCRWAQLLVLAICKQFSFHFLSILLQLAFLLFYDIHSTIESVKNFKQKSISYSVEKHGLPNENCNLCSNKFWLVFFYLQGTVLFRLNSLRTVKVQFYCFVKK